MQSRSQAPGIGCRNPYPPSAHVQNKKQLISTQRNEAHPYVVRALACHRTSFALSTLKRAQRAQQHCLMSE